MALEAHIRELDQRHRDLDAMIIQEMARPLHDDAAIAQLKRQKLQLKDKITQLKDRIKSA